MSDSATPPKRVDIKKMEETLGSLQGILSDIKETNQTFLPTPPLNLTPAENIEKLTLDVSVHNNNKMGLLLVKITEFINGNLIPALNILMGNMKTLSTRMNDTTTSLDNLQKKQLNGNSTA